MGPSGPGRAGPGQPPGWGRGGAPGSPGAGGLERGQGRLSGCPLCSSPKLSARPTVRPWTAEDPAWENGPTVAPRGLGKKGPLLQRPLLQPPAKAVQTGLVLMKADPMPGGPCRHRAPQGSAQLVPPSVPPRRRGRGHTTPQPLTLCRLWAPRGMAGNQRLVHPGPTGVHVCGRARTHACTPVQTHMYTHAHTLTCAHAHAHLCAHAHIHAHAHTRAQAPAETACGPGGAQSRGRGLSTRERSLCGLGPEGAGLGQPSSLGTGQKGGLHPSDPDRVPVCV